MNRRSTFFISVICLILAGCSSGDDNNQVSDGTKYLARNIVFSHDQPTTANSSNKGMGNPLNIDIAPKAYAQSDNIDTETTILAQNVIFETSSVSQIESDNVQDALEEISLRFSNVMIGTWDIQNYNQEELHESTGKVVIYDDGTFDLLEGSFAAIGEGSGTAQEDLCDHLEGSQTYTIYEGELIAFTHYNNLAENSVIPIVVKLRENEIILLGSGGCGTSSRQRISVLTRVSN